MLDLGGGRGHFEGLQPSFQIEVNFEHMPRVVLIGYPVYRYSSNFKWLEAHDLSSPPPNTMGWYFWKGKKRGGGWAGDGDISCLNYIFP